MIIWKKWILFAFLLNMCLFFTNNNLCVCFWPTVVLDYWEMKWSVMILSIHGCFACTILFAFEHWLIWAKDRKPSFCSLIVLYVNDSQFLMKQLWLDYFHTQSAYLWEAWVLGSVDRSQNCYPHWGRGLSHWVKSQHIKRWLWAFM